MVEKLLCFLKEFDFEAGTPRYINFISNNEDNGDLHLNIEQIWIAQEMSYLIHNYIFSFVLCQKHSIFHENLL